MRILNVNSEENTNNNLIKIITVNDLNSIDIIINKGVFSLYDDEVNNYLNGSKVNDSVDKDNKNENKKIYNTYIRINYIKVPVSTV